MKKNNEGKIIKRIQYKDTVSPAGVQKTLSQVKSGKYQQAQLCGTIEATASAVGGLLAASAIGGVLDTAIGTLIGGATPTRSYLYPVA